MVLIKPFTVPVEGIKFQNSAIEALVDNDNHGKGNLYITEENIAWIGSNSGEGFKVAYKKMTLHAISRDPGVHARDCLYIMINGNTLDEDDNFEVECPVEPDDGEEEMTEIRFVPDDTSVLDDLYKAVQECSLLHPDPSSDLSGDDEDPDELFQGYSNMDNENIQVEGDPEMDEIEEEEDEEAERLEQFMRMQLHFQPPGENQNGNGTNGNGGGGPGLNFVPEPGQFDDEDD